MHKLFKLAIFFFITLIFLTLPFFIGRPTYAVQSNCVVTKIGDPVLNLIAPKGCEDLISGIEFPPNMICIPQLSGEIPGEYCQLPPAVPAKTRSVFYSEGPLKNLYEKREQSNKWQDWGSKEIIGVLYTVAKRWKAIYPKGYIIVMDITSDYHISHKWGTAVDITATTDGHDCVANQTGNWRCPYGKYNAQATVLLGELLVDTGYMDLTLHDATTIPAIFTDPNTGKKRNTTVNNAIFLYAKDSYPNKFTNNSFGANTPGIKPSAENDHRDHFHVYIDRDQKNYAHDTNWAAVTERSKLQNCETLTGIARKVCYP